jgi:hypothetical protein
MLDDRRRVQAVVVVREFEVIARPWERLFSLVRD